MTRLSTLIAVAALLAASARWGAAQSPGTAAPPAVSTVTPSSAGVADTGKADYEDARENKGAWRPGKGEWHKDCDGDVQRLCPGMTDRQLIIECLGKNTQRLSPACRQMRAKTEKRWKQEEKREHKKR